MNYTIRDLVKLVDEETVLNVITKGYVHFGEEEIVMDFQIKQVIGSNNLFVRVINHDDETISNWVNLPNRALEAEVEEISGSTDTIDTDGYEHTCIDVVCSDVGVLSRVYETVNYYLEKGGE